MSWAHAAMTVRVDAGLRPGRAHRIDPLAHEEKDDMAKPIWKLDLGDEAPDFTLRATGDHAGRSGPMKHITLSSYRGKKNVMLAFYPAAFTPV